MRHLKKMTLDALQATRVAIDAEIATRKREAGTEFEFEFEATADPRKAMPSVALLTGLDTEGKLERKFLDFDRSYGKRYVTVSGKYTVRAGDILEVQYGGSWKHKVREYCFVSEAGELHTLGSTDDSQLTSTVKKALRGDIERKVLIK